MLGFRQKLFIGYLVIFVVFLAVLFPFAHRAVRSVVNTGLSDRTNQVISNLINEPNIEAMVKHLQDEGSRYFFRITLLTPSAEILFESHTEKLTQPQNPQRYLDNHPELTEALHDGVGYHQGYSYFLGQELVYVARSFSFHGKTYILRTAFPLDQVNELTGRFELGFFTLGFIVLLLFGVFGIAITYHLSRPIKQIIDAITPYQQGKTEKLPHIDIGKRKDEFRTLAETINRLTARIKTQIETLTEERNEREALLESLVEGVIAVDRDMMVTYANETASRMLAIPLIGKPFINARQQEFYDLLRSCQQQKETLAIAAELGEKKKIYLDVIATPSPDGSILILQDKSIHYRILEMRKAFIANASHELKTPITVIQGFSEMLHENPEMDRSMIEEVTTKITNNCLRMTALIKNLLRLADIEHLSRASLETVHLKGLIENCKELTLAAFSHAKITTPVDDITVLGDAELLQHAITNLLDNAAKYSKDPAEITVTLEKTPDYAILRVSDNGIGIPTEDLDQIFDRFYTVDKAHSRRLGGSGLGLSIVRTIAEKHFGKVAVESELGEGSTFSLILPLKMDELLG